MRVFTRAAITCAGLIALADIALGAEPPAASKSVIPTLSDLLNASGLTLSGYVDGTYSYERDETTGHEYNTFALQQAALTLAKQPTTGFGALANVIAGQSPYAATGFG